MAYATVIVGTDGSATAEEAVRAAAGLAAGDDAELVVVTAYGDPEAPGAPADEAAASELARRGEEVGRAVGARRVRSSAAEGGPAEVLLAAADAAGADLIVVGSRGMTRPSRSTLGAVANTVTHNARCDVLVFHTEP